MALFRYCWTRISGTVTAIRQLGTVFTKLQKIYDQPFGGPECPHLTKEGQDLSDLALKPTRNSPMEGWEFHKFLDKQKRQGP